MFLAPLPRNFQQVFLWVQISGVLHEGESSDVTNAFATETFFVCSTLPSTFSVAFARVVQVVGENFLAVSDL